MPAIPLLWSCLSENDKQAIYNGATLAELDASLVEAVALAEREALDDAKRDGRVKKPTRASSARTRSTRRRGRRRKEKRRRRTVASLAPFLRRSATRTTRTMTTNMQHLFTSPPTFLPPACKHLFVVRQRAERSKKVPVATFT